MDRPATAAGEYSDNCRPAVDLYSEEVEAGNDPSRFKPQRTLYENCGLDSLMDTFKLIRVFTH